MFRVIAFASTLAIIDLILHTVFRFWIFVAPNSYEWAMNLFVAGFRLQVSDFDLSFSHIILGTILEAAAFWILGAMVALIYNRLAKSQRM